MLKRQDVIRPELTFSLGSSCTVQPYSLPILCLQDKIYVGVLTITHSLH